MSTAPIANSTRISPLKRLATHATVTCATQASAYGKCIVATYTDVKKDACKEEFEKFGKCVRDAMKRGR